MEHGEEDERFDGDELGDDGVGGERGAEAEVESEETEECDGYGDGADDCELGVGELEDWLGIDGWESGYPDVSEMHTVSIYAVFPGCLRYVCCDGDDD